MIPLIGGFFVFLVNRNLLGFWKKLEIKFTGYFLLYENDDKCSNMVIQFEISKE